MNWFIWAPIGYLIIGFFAAWWTMAEHTVVTPFWLQLAFWFVMRMLLWPVLLVLPR